MVYLSGGAVFGALFLGWIAGMLTFKRSLTWCRVCGSTLTCPDCQRHGLRQMAAKP
jgi:hypothetical protein